jgi:hypothetical protein
MLATAPENIFTYPSDWVTVNLEMLFVLNKNKVIFTKNLNLLKILCL